MSLTTNYVMVNKFYYVLKMFSSTKLEAQLYTVAHMYFMGVHIYILKTDELYKQDD